MWFLFVSWQYRVLGLLGDSDNCPGHWAKTHTHSGRRPATGWIVLQSLWKAVWYFLKKVQLRYHMYFHLYIDTQENKHLNMTAHSCISQSSPILEILQIFNWWMYEQQFIHHWLLSRINKMWSICTMKYWTKLSLGEPWKHDAKWKKPNRKSYLLSMVCSSTVQCLPSVPLALYPIPSTTCAHTKKSSIVCLHFLEIPRIGKFIDTERRLGVAEGWG